MTSDSRSSTLRRIQALIDKAASTTFPEEAEALLAKAQELMTRDAIDEAMLTAAGRGATEEIVTRTLVVEPPYAGPRASLLGGVLRANRCRLVVAGRRGAQHCTLIGYSSDIANSEVLYQALSAQAVRAMLEADAPPWEGLRAFRHAFLLAFAARIGERLRGAASAAHVAASSAPGGGGSFALVLADRSAAVDEALRVQFPHLGYRRTHASSTAGVVGGRAAADRASLGSSPLGPRRALSG